MLAGKRGRRRHGVGGARPFLRGVRPFGVARPARPKAVALTFDDGPSPATPLILEILADSAYPRLFFNAAKTCCAPRNSARPSARPGHEIGNHSHTHPNFALRRPSI